LFGVRGTKKGLKIQPKLPSSWHSTNIKRHFRGAIFNINFTRNDSISEAKINVDGKEIESNIIEDFEKEKTYTVNVQIP